jgi:hypothetical protein
MEAVVDGEADSANDGQGSEYECNGDVRWCDLDHSFIGNLSGRRATFFIP